ncbi:MAG TPA: hypothetical protein VF026_20515 [Ktedonobacteraceae bacterium]
MRAVPGLSKALYCLTQPHQPTAEPDSPGSLWLTFSTDESFNLCLAQPIFVPAQVQLLKVKWMHVTTPSFQFVPAERDLVFYSKTSMAGTRLIQPLPIEFPFKIAFLHRISEEPLLCGKLDEHEYRYQCEE